jgi:DNA-binding CsgD family transcriptional regulator
MYERLAAQAIGEASLFRFLADEIEALVSVGRFQRARELLDWWEHRARAQSRTSALALCARCRALLDAADLDFPQALARLEHALEHYDRLPTPFERARTLLVKGEVERRGNRRRAARATLEEALAIFERLGTPLWASKTRDEHARIGGRRPGRTNELTPTEDQVARLVAQGRTNREVAGALFMSVKTVEANLSRIYRKLDVRSRTELSARLRSAPRPARVEDRKA